MQCLKKMIRIAPPEHARQAHPHRTRLGTGLRQGPLSGGHMWWVVVVIGLAFVSAIFTTPGAAAPQLDQPTSTSPVIIGLPAQEPAPEDPVIQVVIAFRDFFAPEATKR